MTLEIGSGADFNAINWGNGIHFIKTETYPSGGTRCTIPGTSQLLSVPYTLHAKTSADAVKLIGKQTITGKKTFTDTISASKIIITIIGNPVNAQDAATKVYVVNLFNSLKSTGILTDIDITKSEEKVATFNCQGSK